MFILGADGVSSGILRDRPEAVIQSAGRGK
jgi:hypothetical protein